MRIGFDMLAVQSPHHGTAGIGRYSANLVSALLAATTATSTSSTSTTAFPPTASRRRPGRGPHVEPAHWAWARISLLPRSTRPDQPRRARRLCRPQPVRALVDLRTPGSASRRPRSWSRVVYDLIPFLFPDEDARRPRADASLSRARAMTRYDLLLAISEATRQRLPVPAPSAARASGRRSVAASDPGFFTPDRSSPTPDAVQRDSPGTGDRPAVRPQRRRARSRGRTPGS